MVTGHASWGLYLGHFLAPALVGNVIGGVSLVAMLNHAQVKAELQRGGGGEATA